jgi:hypothetical protein
MKKNGKKTSIGKKSCFEAKGKSIWISNRV